MNSIKDTIANKDVPIPDYEVMFEECANEEGRGAGIIRKLFKQNAWKILLSAILYTIKGLPMWASPVVTANVINLATKSSPNSWKLILINIGVLLILLLQNIPSHMVYARFTDKMLRNVGAGLRNTLVRKLQQLSVTFHKEIESGRIQSKFMRDIEAIEFLNTHFVKSVIPAIIGIVISITIAAKESGIVTLFFLFVIPANVATIYGFRKRMRQNNRNFRKEAENISAKVSNMIEMIPITKAHGLENEEIGALENNIKALREKGLILDKTNAYFASSTWVFNHILAAVCLVFTGYLALGGKIEPGDISLYLALFTSISNSVLSLVNIFPELNKGLESIRSVSEIMLSDDIENNKGKIRLRYVHGTVHFDNVFYRYPGTNEDVIKDFSLHVNEGECIAFVGASGSGKSTIMNMIIGFLKATGGQLSIDGKPIGALNLTDYRHFISVVPQNSILFTGSIKDNITYGLPKVSNKRLTEVLELANINEFANELPNGINTLIGEHGGKLSGGQKQRISIARALIRDPRILILDEATSALDNISEFHVQKAISQLIKGRTTFIVAHRLSTIRDADKIVVMDNGKCAEFGTYDELMAKKGKFYDLKTLSDMRTEPVETVL